LSEIRPVWDLDFLLFVNECDDRHGEIGKPN